MNTAPCPGWHSRPPCRGARRFPSRPRIPRRRASGSALHSRSRVPRSSRIRASATAVSTSCVRPEQPREHRERILRDRAACRGRPRRARPWYRRPSTGSVTLPRPHHLRLSPRHALHVLVRRLAGLVRLVDVRGGKRVRHADLREQFAPTWRGGSKTQHWIHASVPVIRMVVEDTVRPIKLLGQHDAHQRVRQGQRRQRPFEIAAGKQWSATGHRGRR